MVLFGPLRALLCGDDTTLTFNHPDGDQKCMFPAPVVANSREHVR